MTTATILTSICPSAKDQQEQKLKRMRPRKVSWKAGDKLCQVRLFAAEDAPFLSSVAQQDLYEAKRANLMHAVTPVLSEDLPPGFEDAAVKRAKWDAEAICAMLAQITWKTPERLFYDPTWQVATGYESSEVAAECDREMKVLEAVYPRVSVIPPSPVELQKLQETSEAPQVRIIPLEEAEDGGLDEDTEKTVPFGEGTTLSIQDYGEQSGNFLGISSAAFSSSSSLSMVSAQSRMSLSGDLLVFTDLDIATAAAAAVAVIRAKESGAMVDHELLIKILSNPRLIEMVVASNPGLKSQLRLLLNSKNGQGQLAPGPLFYPQSGRLLQEGKPSSISQGTASPPIMTLPQPSSVLNDDGGLPPGWSGNAPGSCLSSQGRFFNPMVSNSQESILNGNTGVPFHPSKETCVLQGQPFLPHPELATELMQHGSMGTAELRHSVQFIHEENRLFQDLERYQVTQWGQRWSGGNVPTSASGSSISKTRAAGLNFNKSKRLCLFYNTPRGCRSGANCEYVHDTGSK